MPIRTKVRTRTASIFVHYRGWLQKKNRTVVWELHPCDLGTSSIFQEGSCCTVTRLNSCSSIGKLVDLGLTFWTDPTFLLNWSNKGPWIYSLVYQIAFKLFAFLFILFYQIQQGKKRKLWNMRVYCYNLWVQCHALSPPWIVLSPWYKTFSKGVS